MKFFICYLWLVLFFMLISNNCLGEFKTMLSYGVGFITCYCLIG
jgi:hypothetical protein